MAKRFFKNISQSFSTYVLATLNVAHAIKNQSYDWLLWLSLALVSLSLILSLVSAIKGGEENA